MDKFPAWAQPWLKGGDQVSHGLNLALKLQSPNLMPLLLWDIVVSRPKIQRAMEELTFIHYARFVPSWDGTALMVTTEFDGPLEPYVMDFVIALGDVFDVLLSYVDKGIRPKLPVRDHPDEFWAFIQQWNRVPFMRRLGNDSSVLLPADFDYPLYSAYPGKTVIDIEGKREKLLPPSIDHPAATIDLADVQGNILHGYRAQEAVHVFYQVADRKKARKWLSTVLVTDARWRGIRTAERWQKKPPVMVNVGFTFAGLKALLPERQSDLDWFPDAFKQGAEARGELNGDVGRSAPGQWLFGRDSQNIHVVVSVYKGDEPSKESAEAKQSTFLEAGLALFKSAEDNGLLRVCDHAAHDLDGGKVYFGYQDGIAQPRISGQCPMGKTDLQPAASPGEFLLGSTYASIFGGPSIGNLPADLARNGTFGALRLLEQDVQKFEAAVAQAATQLPLAPDQIKAKMLGRELSGKPLTPPPTGLAGLNAFDYARSWEYPSKALDDHEGLVCPAGAHIRRTNPRTARVAGQRHSRRLIRRGMPSSWKEGNEDKVGLLGLFIGASLERQFEFVQRQWIQGDLAASGIRGTQDPLVGLRDKPTEFRIPGVGKMDVPPLVTTRGSLYLLFPSLSMLRALNTPARPLELRVLEQQLARPGPFEPATGLVRSEQMRAELNGVADVLGDIWELVSTLLSRQLDSPWVEGLFGQLLPYSEDPVNPLGAPTSDLIKPLDPEFVVNPYDAFEKLRIQKVRAVWVPEHNAYWVLGYDDCKLLLDNPGSFRQQKAATTLRGILSLDPPRHTAVRAVVKAALDVAMGKDEVLLKDRVNAAVVEALNRIGTLQQFDFVSQYGSDVPRTVFWRTMGISDADSPHLHALAQTLMEHFNQPQQKGSVEPAVSADASLRLAAHIGALLAKAMAGSLAGGLPQFKGTLIGELAKKTQFLLQPSGHTTWDGRELGFLETLMTLVQFALASMSGQFLLGTAMRNLLMPVPPGDPKGMVPWKALGVIYKNSKEAFGQALQVALREARRFDTPVTIVQRYAVEGAEIAGLTSIPADTAVFAVVASANRDGQANLEQFQWNRDPTGVNNLALGYGIHECVGALFQDTMLPIAITRLMESMPDLGLCDTEAVPAWTNNIYFRVLQALPVKRCP